MEENDEEEEEEELGEEDLTSREKNLRRGKEKESMKKVEDARGKTLEGEGVK